MSLSIYSGRKAMLVAFAMVAAVAAGTVAAVAVSDDDAPKDEAKKSAVSEAAAKPTKKELNAAFAFANDFSNWTTLEEGEFTLSVGINHLTHRVEVTAGPEFPKADLDKLRAHSSLIVVKQTTGPAVERQPETSAP